MISPQQEEEFCPFAFSECYGARDLEIFERVCSKKFKFCSSSKEGIPITQGEWNSNKYAVDFIDPLTNDRIILSGEN